MKEKKESKILIDGFGLATVRICMRIIQNNLLIHHSVQDMNRVRVVVIKCFVTAATKRSSRETNG